MPRENFLVAIDFDGVIHTYEHWDGDPPRGDPIDGVREALELLKRLGGRAVCFTARNPVTTREWLQSHDLDAYFDHVTNTKPKAAIAFFDDRAYHVRANVPGDLLRAIREALGP